MKITTVVIPQRDALNLNFNVHFQNVVFPKGDLVLGMEYISDVCSK